MLSQFEDLCSGTIERCVAAQRRLVALESVRVGGYREFLPRAFDVGVCEVIAVALQRRVDLVRDERASTGGECFVIVACRGRVERRLLDL